MPAPEENRAAVPAESKLRCDVRFPDTRWSLVANADATDAGLRERAVSELCRLYWYPVYAFARSRGWSPQQAEDLTQDLFMSFVQRESFRRANRDKGKLRTYLLSSMAHLLANEVRRSKTAKRAPEAVAISIDRDEAEERLKIESSWSEIATPDQQFDRRWAEAVLHGVEERLSHEYESRGKGSLFAALKGYLAGELTGTTHAQTGAAHGLSEGAVKLAVHRLRNRFKLLLRDEVEQTVADPALVDEELQSLCAALAH